MAFGKSTRPRQENAAGVVSTSPGVVLGSDTASSRPIALAGRVPVNVTMEGGAIAVGDFLVSSSTSGKAMRANGPADAGIIGIALSAYDGTAVSARDFGDGIAHEAGHQVMMLVHVGAGSQAAVAKLKETLVQVQADAAQKELQIRNGQLESAQLKADAVQLKADAVQLKADAAQLKASAAQLKTEKDEEIAQLRADAAQLKADSAQMKAFLCTQSPHAPMCGIH